ncbi:MAG: RAMP superfamily CRISPR-associated protein, partial [bacterium]
MTTTYLPYNFVPFGKAAERQKVRTHEKLEELSGEFVCQLETLTPLFVAGHYERIEKQEHPELSFNSIGDAPIIPGSSLKGAIRSIAEAISGSCLTLPLPRWNPQQQKEEFSYKRKSGGWQSFENFPDFKKCGHQSNRRFIKVCPACQIFGFLNKSVHLGLVNFSDGRVFGEFNFDWQTLAPTGQPRPAHTPFYGTPESKFKTLRGRKFYYHRPQGILTSSIRNNQNKTVQTVETGTVFTFRVSYESLSENELALLVFALELESSMRHKIGMGKSLGLGSVEIKITEWEELDYKARFKSLGGGSKTFSEDALRVEIDKYKQTYKKAYVGWQDSLNVLASILHWDEHSTIDRRHPSNAWFKDNGSVILENVPADAWKPGQGPQASQHTAPSYQRAQPRRPASETAFSPKHDAELRKLQRQAEEAQQQQALAQASYQHREVERARII